MIGGPEAPDHSHRVTRSARLERIRARAPRYLLIAATVLLSTLGFRELVAPAAPASDATALSTSADPAMESFAEQFARAYLTYDAARPEARERALAPFVPDSFGPDAGFSPRRGRADVLWTTVAQNQEALAGGRIITVAAQVSEPPGLVHLAVPLQRLDGALSLAGYPALIGSPAVRMNERPPSRERVSDREVLDAVGRVLRNYLAGAAENLNADLAPHARVTLPGGRLRLTSLDDVVWATETNRAVLATVTARDRRGDYTLTYELGLRFVGGRPLVDFIETVPTAP